MKRRKAEARMKAVSGGLREEGDISVKEGRK